MSARPLDQEMNVVDELDRLAELRERAHLSPAEYNEAKQRLLEAARPAVGATHTPDGAYLLYRLISSWLRRAAAAMAVIALLFAVVAGWSASHYLDVNAQAKAVKDRSIVQGFGVKVPDPRPTIERTTLEAEATAYGGLAAITGVIALSTLAGALIVRPPTPREQGHADRVMPTPSKAQSCGGRTATNPSMPIPHPRSARLHSREQPASASSCDG
jgi:hypothetical protein